MPIALILNPRWLSEAEKWGASCCCAWEGCRNQERIQLRRPEFRLLRQQKRAWRNLIVCYWPPSVSVVILPLPCWQLAHRLIAQFQFRIGTTQTEYHLQLLCCLVALLKCNGKRLQHSNQKENCSWVVVQILSSVYNWHNNSISASGSFETTSNISTATRDVLIETQSSNTKPADTSITHHLLGVD